MSERYSQWLHELTLILEDQARGMNIHPAHGEMLSARRSYMERLSSMSSDKLAEVIVNGPGHETDELLIIYRSLYSLTPADMAPPSNPGFVKIAVRIIAHWRFHFMTVYHAGGDTYKMTCIDIAGRVFEEDISPDEFNSHRNASSTAGSDAPANHFGMACSSRWQPGHGDDVAFRLDSRYIISFTDTGRHERTMSDHEITGLSLVARLLAERIRGKRDPLTGLPNRRAWDEYVNRASTAKGYYLMFAIDGFKEINDKNGHIFGDAIVKRAGSMLRKVFGTSGSVYRWSGAEFIVYTDIGLAADMAESFRRMVESENFVSGTREARITVSAGISHNSDDDYSDVIAAIDAALARADSGVALAKGRGRNRIEVVDNL